MTDDRRDTYREYLESLSESERVVKRSCYGLTHKIRLLTSIFQNTVSNIIPS